MSQQQRSPHEDFIMAFIVAFLTFGIGWFIWHFFWVEITNFVRWVRIAELEVVRLIYGENFTVYAPDPRNADTWQRWLLATDPEKISVAHIKASTAIAVTPLKNLFLAMMAVMLTIIFFKGPGTQFKRRMGLEALMREQAKAFPGISPLLKFNPGKMPFRVLGQAVPSTLPMFSEALTPEEWLSFHSICTPGNAAIDPDKTYRALALQLGNRWQGPLHLPIHMQGLFAAFALKHARKRKESETLLNQLALSWSPGGSFRPSFSLKRQIRKIIKDPKLGGSLQKHADKHAFETTAMLRALNRARDEGGVLAPAEFLWLRGFDRNLWYPLNNLGRKSYHAEAAGAMVHYTNELIAGQKIPTPRFEDVIRGLKSYMKGLSARAIPELQHVTGEGRK